MPKIFLISYRRADTAAVTGRIVDRLIARYGTQSLFIDIDNIPLGVDFRDHIRDSLVTSDVTLAMIGPAWLGLGHNGESRLSQPDDPVRVELETATASAVPIIPVLVDGAAMPTVDILPHSLGGLAFLNAASVHSGRDFHQQVDRLIEAIDVILARKYGAVPGVAPVAPPPAAAPAPAPAVGSRLVLALAPAIGVLALPFALALGAFAPPWPKGAMAITVIAELVVMAVAFQFASAAGRRASRWLVLASAIVALLCGGAYVAGVSLYTFQTPRGDRLYARGLECTPEARLVYRAKCPNLGPDELAAASYEAPYLWTRGSIAKVQILLLALWLGAFIAAATLAAGLAAGAARQA